MNNHFDHGRQELALCTNRRHHHCARCGCPMTILVGEPRRTCCFSCITRGLAEREDPSVRAQVRDE